MQKSRRPLPDQIGSPTVVLMMMRRLHSTSYCTYPSSLDSNDLSSSFQTCVHRNKSEVPVVFPAETLRYLSQYAGFTGKLYDFCLCTLTVMCLEKSVFGMLV